MRKKNLTFILSLFLLVFYAAIIVYVFVPVLHINALTNFCTAAAFEIIGFILLSYFVFEAIAFKTIKTGYFVPLMIVTVFYTIILDAITFLFVFNMADVLFTLVNFIWLFVYCLVSVPMYIMGRK